MSQLFRLEDYKTPKGLYPSINQRINLSLEQIPPMSVTTAKVLRLVNDIDASPADLLRVIRLDPVLTCHILKLINSPLFGLERKISSIGRAFVILGINTVKNIVRSSAAYGMLTHSLYGKQLSNYLWNHSLTVGIAARAVARSRQVSRKEQEEAFLGGLLHDLGEICLLKAAPELFSQVQEGVKCGGGQLELEHHFFGVTHEEVGLRLARLWNLNEPLSQCMANHHQPTLVGPYAEICCTVFMANSLTSDQPLSFERMSAPREVLNVLGVKADRLMLLRSEIQKDIAAAQLFLEH